MIPAKPKMQAESVDQIKATLKTDSIDTGHAHADNFGFQASRFVGKGVQGFKGRYEGQQPWRSRATNFPLGIDPYKTLTDYKSCFAGVMSPVMTRNKERIAIKQQMTHDSVKVQNSETSRL
jgi:hypothetical protein